MSSHLTDGAFEFLCREWDHKANVPPSRELFDEAVTRQEQESEMRYVDPYAVAKSLVHGHWPKGAP